MRTVRLCAPKGCTNVQHGPETFAVVDGFVDVPPDLAVRLVHPRHGFVPAPLDVQPQRKVLHLKK